MHTPCRTKSAGRAALKAGLHARNCPSHKRNQSDHFRSGTYFARPDPPRAGDLRASRSVRLSAARTLARTGSTSQLTHGSIMDS